MLEKAASRCRPWSELFNEQEKRQEAATEEGKRAEHQPAQTVGRFDQQPTSTDAPPSVDLSTVPERDDGGDDTRAIRATKLSSAGRASEGDEERPSSVVGWGGTQSRCSWTSTASSGRTGFCPSDDEEKSSQRYVEQWAVVGSTVTEDVGGLVGGEVQGDSEGVQVDDARRTQQQ
ncbi:hypothetical protein G7046_g7539 [Stylonectria norvegica]|nr:hypothetical protein G7046_g7539 [Stylonectria norvegica]